MKELNAKQAELLLEIVNKATYAGAIVEQVTEIKDYLKEILKTKKKLTPVPAGKKKGKKKKKGKNAPR